MTRFDVFVRPQELDLPLCVSCGQVFRWVETPRGWTGVDGEHVFACERIDGGWSVATNGGEDDFRRLFRFETLQSDLEKRLIELGPELAPYIVRLPGLRLMRPSDAIEETFSFLCTPNNNLPRILAMVRGLAAYGDPLPGFDLTRFPTIERIAAIPEDELRSKGFGYRGRTIPSLARQMLERGGGAWLWSLREAAYADARRELMSLSGIGPKLADCICLFALHHTEAAPVDTHLWQAATREYFPQWRGTALTGARYDAIGDHFRKRFGALAGWAHQYLFYDNLLRRKPGITQG